MTGVAGEVGRKSDAGDHGLTAGTVVGLDLSLTGSAACAIPLDWDHDLEAVRTLRAGGKLRQDANEQQHIERIEAIAEAVVRFCLEMNACHVYVEQYAFAERGNRGHRLAELGGVVKYTLFLQLGLAAEPVQAATARKVLLQRLPRRDVKAYVQANVLRLGGPTLRWTNDEVDAFVIANYGLMLRGGTAMTFLGTEGGRAA